MNAKQDIELIRQQEKALVFQRFDEQTAFDLGCAIRDEALKNGLGVYLEVATWDRRLFAAATPGSAGSNVNWARRKLNVVRMFGRATYAMVLEQQRDDRMLAPAQGLSVEDYVLAGGGFPIRVANAGMVGGIAVSGLPEREDHKLIVAALCKHLGVEHRPLALDL
ncbi:MAG: heme-degrading domain-containing protein [Rhizobiaceae bacterium]|nr:heme-degrading domain-containing protein [Rhizobiaceae bacterium]MCV0408499.1 heme-degrading domain-containing protein [Rhizobiaceae bacterium]